MNEEAMERSLEEAINLRLDLRVALRKLSVYDGLIVYMAFRCELTLEQIAERVGLTRMGVQKQLDRALAEIKKMMDE